MLIAMAGLPGSGKSTLALDLGQELSCTVLGVDQAEAAIWRAGVSRSQPTHHAAYLVVATLAAAQLSLGHDVIIDAVNGPEPARAQWRELGAKLDTQLRFIVVDCSDDRAYQDRLKHRVRDIPGLPAPTWDDILRRRDAFPPWTDDRLVIDSTNPRATNLQTALNYLAPGCHNNL